MKVIERIGPLCLPQRDQAKMKERLPFGGTDLRHTTELALGFGEHPRAVERDAKIAMFVES